MALNINRLIHHNDFNLSTKSLGTIRCGPLSPVKKFAEFEKRIADNNIDGVALACGLLQSCARKLTGDTDIDDVCGGPELAGAEVEALSKEELDDFCDKFIAKRLQFAVPADSDAIIPEISGVGCERIVQALCNFADAERTASQKLKMRIDEVTRGASAFSVFTDNTLKSIRQNYLFSDKLSESIAAFRLPDISIKPPPQIDPVAAIRLPHIPPNPIYKTNEALETLLGNIEQMRPVLADCATLIQSMNSTALQMQADAIKGSEIAERHSKWAMRVAIGSIVISIVVGVASIRYAQLSPTAEQADELVGKLEKQIGALAAAGQEDRAALIKALGADHASAKRK